MNKESKAAVASQPVKAAGATGQSVVFTGHNAYLMSVARVCREAKKFTDVTLVSNLKYVLCKVCMLIKIDGFF